MRQNSRQKSEEPIFPWINGDSFHSVCWPSETHLRCFCDYEGFMLLNRLVLKDENFSCSVFGDFPKRLNT